MTGQGRPPIRETATTAALRQAGTPLRTLASGLANARARRRTDSHMSGARSSAFAALGVVATAALFFALLPGLSPPLFPIAVAQDSSERTDAVESRGKSFLGRLGGPLRGPLAQRESSREQIREPSREPNRDQGGASRPPPSRDNPRGNSDTPGDTSRDPPQEAPVNTPQDSPPVQGPAASIAAPPLELHLRLTWGGGAARNWTGAARLSAGRFGEFRHLGLNGEEPGSIDRVARGTGGQTLSIHGTTESVFHGCDLQVAGPPTAEVTIELAPADAPNDVRRFTARLDTLVSTPLSHSLDEQRNRVQLARVPGDRLRVEFERDQLVFEPGEIFPFTVIANATGQENAASSRIRIWLAPARSAEELSRQEYELRPRAAVLSAEAACSVRLPEQEGIYDIHVELLARRGGVGLPLSRARPLMARRIQVVVMPSIALPTETGQRDARGETRYALPFSLNIGDSPNWRRIAEYDPAAAEPLRGQPTDAATETRVAGPANSGSAETTDRRPEARTDGRPETRTEGRAWSNWLPGMPMWKPANETAGVNEPSRSARVIHRGQNYLRLEPGGWVLQPLAVSRAGEPHILEIEYANDLPQCLGVSVLETDAAGRLLTQGLDTGFEVPPLAPGVTPALERHRVVFWPQGRSAWALIVNRHPTAPAYAGRLAVEAGPPRLPPSPFTASPPVFRSPASASPASASPASASPGSTSAGSTSPGSTSAAPGKTAGSPPTSQRGSTRRLVVAFLDRPLIAETFQAPRAPESDGSAAWLDWVSFYQGASRLVDYLKFAGYNAAVINVASEGSSLYPSGLLEPNPRHDSGVFLADGQDPVRKDVLELLFRLFDREGLKLIPAIEFAGPLPELERLARSAGAEATGVRWIGADGRTLPFARIAAQADWATNTPPTRPDRTSVAAETPAENSPFGFLKAGMQAAAAPFSTAFPPTATGPFPSTTAFSANPLFPGVSASGGARRDWRIATLPTAAYSTATAHALRGKAPRYNLLDPAVRAASLRVLEELEQRYGHHPAWGGASLQIGPDSFAALPGAEAGYDDRTMAAFTADTGISVPVSAPAPDNAMARFTARAKFLEGEARERWIGWRASQTAAFYAAARDRIAKRQPQSLLVLNIAQLRHSPALQPFTQPALPVRQTATDSLRLAGLDPAEWQDQPGIVCPRPFLDAPLLSLAGQGTRLEWNRASELDRLLNANSPAGGLVFQESLAWQLVATAAAPDAPTAKNIAPLTAPLTTPRFTQFLAAGGRQRQSLTRALRSDDGVLFGQGGRSLALSADPQWRQTLAIYGSLPPLGFETLAPAIDSQSQAVTVRQAAVDDAAYVYALNDAPWPVSVEIRLDGPAELRAELLGQGGASPRGGPAAGAGAGLPGKNGANAAAKLQRVQGQWLWRIALEPHDLRALRLDSPQAIVREWNAVVAPEVPQALQARMNSARTRAHNLNAPAPLKTLANAGFELGVATESNAATNGNTASLAGTASGQGAGTMGGLAPAHWLNASGPGIAVALESTDPHGGRSALRIRSERDVVWVRSDPVPAPATGRIAVWAWIRAMDKASQSPLRLAIEGKIQGKTYYRYATVGGGKGAAIPNTWTQYWFQIDDLPVGELAELRIGIDLMGPGDVAIDDLAAYDLWFHDNERDELVKQLGIAGFQLGHGRLLDCHRFLDGYWPRFLEEFVPGDPPAVEFTGTTAPGSAASSSSLPAAATAPNGTTTSGRPTDRGIRPPAASLRRNGAIRPRIGPDAPGNFPEAQNRPATGRPPAKPSASALPGNRASNTDPNSPGPNSPVTTSPDRQTPTSGRNVTGTPPPRSSATSPTRVGGPAATAPAAAMPPVIEPEDESLAGDANVARPAPVVSPPGPKAAQSATPPRPTTSRSPAPANGDKPAAETTWRDRLESLLPKRFW